MTISQMAGIDVEYLNGKNTLEDACIAQKMSWAASRQKTRPENIAYCLLGLFGISLPLLYGEGQRSAFRRLQETIIAQSDDDSIFAWRTASPEIRGLLADEPREFAASRRVRRDPCLALALPFRVTNLGIELSCFTQAPGLWDVLFPRLPTASQFMNVITATLSINGRTRLLQNILTLSFLRVGETRLILTCFELPMEHIIGKDLQSISLHLKTPWPIFLGHFHRWYRTETNNWAASSIRSKLSIVAVRPRFEAFRVTIFVSASNSKLSGTRDNEEERTWLWMINTGLGMALPCITCYMYWSWATRSSPVLPGVYLAIPAILIFSIHLGADPRWVVVASLALLIVALATDFRESAKRTPP
jgi:hypothetical protein